MNNHTLKAKETALLVVDIQVDGVSPDGKAVQKFHKQISHKTRMLPLLKEFIKTIKQKRVFVVYSRHIEDKKLVQENTRYLFKKKNWEFGLYLKNSKGSGIYHLTPEHNDLIIEKITWDLFSNPKLDVVLKQRSIKNLIITGVDTECCVFSTVSSAFMRGYNVFVPKELVATTDHKIGKYQETVLKIIDTYYGFVMKKNDILDSLS